MGFGNAVKQGVLAKVIAKVAEQAPNYLLQNSVAKKKEDEKKKMAYGGKVRKMKKGGSVKDACYKKVKAQYKVFPSAYASGAIAKCRKNRGK